ncbi:MAG TPA: hypothetical protein VM537_06500 [Anaerolineae bacterium]|nr:hypothetical protein [Anaerolineae bacterium]
MKIKLLARRHETYTAELTVEANSVREAIDKARGIANRNGWDALFLAENEGEYEECWTEIIDES